VRVEQRGIDARVQLVGGDNNVLEEADDAIGNQGTEKLDIVAEDDGAYKIVVRPKLKRAKGACQVSLAETRLATSLDRTLNDVRQLRTRVRHLLDANLPPQAVLLAEQAVALAQGAPGVDEVDVALATRDLAEVGRESGVFREAQTGFPRMISSTRP
jgi:hypothetical protein